MTILVTGGAGYVGSHMAYHLADRGEHVLVLDDLSRGTRDLVPPGADFVYGDLGDAALLDRIFRLNRIEAVVHCGGYIIVPESFEAPFDYYRRNTAASATLIEACVRHGVTRFIFSSSAAVYGVAETIPIPETAPLNPLSPYGRSKLMTEMMLSDADAAHGLRSVSLRYFNVAGADPELRTGQVSKIPTHLIKIASQVALGERDKLTVFGTDYPTPDGTCIRDYVHVADLVSAHAQALDYLRDGGTTLALNCGYKRGFSVLEVIKAMETVLGSSLPVEMGARRIGDPPELVADPTKIQNLLGWAPRFDDLEAIIRSALDWERSMPDFTARPDQTFRAARVV